MNAGRRVALIMVAPIYSCGAACVAAAATTAETHVREAEAAALRVDEQARWAERAAME